MHVFPTTYYFIDPMIDSRGKLSLNRAHPIFCEGI